MIWIATLFYVFLLWTLAIYWLHRLAHWRHRYNPLHYLHLSHHEINYFKTEKKFKIAYLLWIFGDWRATLDILLNMTLPLVILTYFYPSQGLFLLVFHYLYEAFLSEGVLDHNPNIRGTITNYFAWGVYHLQHHNSPKYNFSLIVTVWDRVFGTRALER